MSKTNWIEVGLGLLLISPADEFLLGATTGGASIAVAGAQVPLSAALGGGLVAHGFGVI